MRILLVCSRFTVSGVPLAQIRLAKALSAAGHDVELIMGYVSDSSLIPRLDGIKIQVWSNQRTVAMLPSLIRHLLTKKPDIVFSAEDHMNIIVLLSALLSRSAAKISCSSRVSPIDTHTQRFGAYSDVPFSKRWFLKQVMKIVMPRADVLTCVSIDMAKEYRKHFKNSRHVAVYNIVVDAMSLARMEEDIDDEWFAEKKVPVIVAAGTLARRKGFAELIQAFSQVRRKRHVRLLIMGEGPSRDMLGRLISDLNLDEDVRLPGIIENPLKYFRRSDVFVLSSFAEGLPNVLVEAMMCGCTPVATDCPTGPREVLSDGKYGYLVSVGDPMSIASGIECALEKPIDRNLLAEAIAPFEEQAVLARHFKLLGLIDDRRKCLHPAGQHRDSS
ncbi:hypothetical protein AMST5_03886 [freshwater sediment metagenome]|uniref:Glycosyltransferase n=1 Tax=freshwater sediment metagenome TaxID=556182 RepID=A0AA48M5E8_9ZZZZ